VIKKVSLNIIIVLILFTVDAFATSVNGRFVIVKSDSAKLSVLVQINTNTGSDDMGGATIVISFDKNVLSFSSNPTVDKDFKFYNFSGGNYNDATVTRPLSDKVWINILLPTENDNKGKVVSGLSGWTDVATLNFDKKNPRDTSTVKWLQNNIFWQVYDGDNKTSWTNGNFTNLTNIPSAVELLSFTAQLIDNTNIKLDWSAISYADNEGFDVERSQKSNVNGQDSYEKIGFVKSQGVLNTTTNYSFTDNKFPTSGNLKYRIKSVNKDGSFVVLSETEIAAPAVPLTFQLDQNYPNPFNPSTKIKYTIPNNVTLSGVEGSKVLLKVYDILGNEITTLVDEVQGPGQHEVEFKADNLASGVYLYRLEVSPTGGSGGQGFTATKKMILLR
jgi:hypothetical protein